MKTSRTTLVATAVSLLATSLPVVAGELPFNAPTTERAKESTLLLHQAAQALADLPAGAALRSAGNGHISNLWLFPTADADTVFARYNVTAKGEAANAPAGTEHLTVLTVRGNRILEARDLTARTVELASVEATPNEPPKLHWSAAIGTGHAADTTVTNPAVASGPATNTVSTSGPHEVHASPDRTAKIGTGSAASAAAPDSRVTPDTKQSDTPRSVAAAHWTSRIGTGHASDSTI